MITDKKKFGCRTPFPPGFIDLQINGYEGISFSDASLTKLLLLKACRGILRDGATVGFLPTIITSPSEVYESVLPLIATLIETQRRRIRKRQKQKKKEIEEEKVEERRKAWDHCNDYRDDHHRHHELGGEESDEDTPLLLGIHLEGPFISSEPGARGCHDARYVVPCDVDLLQKWQKMARGHIKLITIAAELPNAVALCTAARALGIVVSLGHSLATPNEIEAVVSAGASLLTHFGNGTPAHASHRHWWAAGLADPRLTAMLISDGHHLPPVVIAACLRAKGLHGCLLTSDASPFAGLPHACEYNARGSFKRAYVSAEGAVVDVQTKTKLAGSGFLLRSCVQTLMKMLVDFPHLFSSRNCVHQTTRRNIRKDKAVPSPAMKSSPAIEMTDDGKNGGKEHDKDEEYDNNNDDDDNDDDDNVDDDKAGKDTYQEYLIEPRMLACALGFTNPLLAIGLDPITFISELQMHLPGVFQHQA